MKTRYEDIVDGKPFVIRAGKASMDLACCDCGLVHEIDVKVLNTRRVKLALRVNKRKTAALRRHVGIEGGATGWK